MDTYSAKAEDVDRQWWHVDLEGVVLGRAASQIATLLRGKHKPIFTPHVDCGDFVICTNCADIVLTGSKLDDKVYRRHSQYPGGLDEITARELLDKKPTKVVEYAIWGMLPHNRLGREIVSKLKLYPGADHPHEAQQPSDYELDL
ncbi:MAG: 50S ribosomal protein L13 [Bradymonadaceae bacterium]